MSAFVWVLCQHLFGYYVSIYLGIMSAFLGYYVSIRLEYYVNIFGGYFFSNGLDIISAYVGVLHQHLFVYYVSICLGTLSAFV